MNIRVRLTDVSVTNAGPLAAKAADTAARHISGSITPTPAPPGTENDCQEHGCEFIGAIEDGDTTYLVYYCPATGEYVTYKKD